MRVLITGGAGFVGSHLADACLLRGDEVYVLDDLSTGSIDNIEYLKRHPPRASGSADRGSSSNRSRKPPEFPDTPGLGPEWRARIMPPPPQH